MTIIPLWLTTVLAIAASFVCAAGESSHNVKESVAPPRGWSKQTPAPGDRVIQLRIGLPQPNFNVLEEHLYQVSDPFHQRYGQHLSKEEVEHLVAPNSQSIRLVDEWLTSHGLVEDVISRSPAKDWVTITIPISLAEKMLDTVRTITLCINCG
jgi:tripeptidyl-peptidase-1